MLQVKIYFGNFSERKMQNFLTPLQISVLFRVEIMQPPKFEVLQRLFRLPS